MSASSRTPRATEAAGKARLTLDLLVAAATGLGRVVRRSGETLIFELALARSDGRAMRYTLAINADGQHAEAREAKPEHLPAGCPNRHINFDGGFCLNWQVGEPLLVTDEAAAELWWSRLQQYLRRQGAAARLRRWPGEQWAHGEAAHHQRRAERAAAALGPAFVQDLRRGRLAVSPVRKGFIQLRRGGQLLYAVWAKQQRVATLRQACVCGGGLIMRDCHWEAAAELVLALATWRRAEASFWASMKDHTCCGTLDECPLKKPTPLAPETSKLAA